jgi:hypothetical protein
VRKINMLVIGALVGALVAGPVLAASGDVCLQNNRIWSWRMINQRTLLVTDVNYHPYIVRLTGGCVGLTNAIQALAFRTWTNLGCLKRGDEVIFHEPTLGRMSCFVTDVEPDHPTQAQSG